MPIPTGFWPKVHQHHRTIKSEAADKRPTGTDVQTPPVLLTLAGALYLRFHGTKVSPSQPQLLLKLVCRHSQRCNNKGQCSGHLRPIHITVSVNRLTTHGTSDIPSLECPNSCL